MKLDISVIIPTLNESTSISVLLDSIIDQSLSPGEIIVVDGGSTDGTQNRIKAKIAKFSRIKFFSLPGSNISEARNYGITKSSFNIIACIDSGCIANYRWLEKLTSIFYAHDKNKTFVSGGYATYEGNVIQTLTKNYFGLKFIDQLKNRYLPSARSMAFTKKSWKDAGGFSESIKKAGEDTYFVHKLLNSGSTYVCRPEAYVIWNQPDNFFQIIKKIFCYSVGDGENFRSAGLGIKHSRKVLLLMARYSFLILIFLLNKYFGILALLFAMIYSFLKINKPFYYILFIPFYIAIKLVLDLSVIVGFVTGLFLR